MRERDDTADKDTPKDALDKIQPNSLLCSRTCIGFIEELIDNLGHSIPLFRCWDTHNDVKECREAETTTITRQHREQQRQHRLFVLSPRRPWRE